MPAPSVTHEPSADTVQAPAGVDCDTKKKLLFGGGVGYIVGAGVGARVVVVTGANVDDVVETDCAHIVHPSPTMEKSESHVMVEFAAMATLFGRVVPEYLLVSVKGQNTVQAKIEFVSSTQTDGAIERRERESEREKGLVT